MATQTETPSPDAVLAFWFGELDGEDVADDGKRDMWFNGSDALDNTIRERFLGAYEAALGGRLGGWRETARGALALVVVLDQFPLNMFRRTARAFESEHAAVDACQAAVAAGLDRELVMVERTFLYMPLMHAEDLALQDASVDHYAALAADAPSGLRERAERTLDFARNHRDIVARFGRFPHRNAVLNRENTAAESEYLAAGPASYGQ
ncbi:MAG: DUF924 family protein [Pseudomonadota bacterium]